MVNLLQERGYAYNDPAFTILFFSDALAIYTSNAYRVI